MSNIILFTGTQVTEELLQKINEHAVEEDDYEEESNHYWHTTEETDDLVAECAMLDGHFDAALKLSKLSHMGYRMTEVVNDVMLDYEASHEVLTERGYFN